ncbi:MAG TPA: DUF222 domain-containing protein [Mycobacteriales bacterium]|nr:DUF222 domain-containing protein [Mycobacteriales bacterium]
MQVVEESVVERLLRDLLDSLPSASMFHGDGYCDDDGGAHEHEDQEADQPSQPTDSGTSETWPLWGPPAPTAPGFGAAWDAWVAGSPQAGEGEDGPQEPSDSGADSGEPTTSGRADGSDAAESAVGSAPADEDLWRAPGVDDSRGTQSKPPLSQTVDPGTEIHALVTALDAVAAQDPCSLGEGEALARTRALLQSAERMRALAVQALADVESRKLYVLDDTPTVNSWVSGLAVPGVDSAEITLARRLRRVPQIAEEIAAGRMSTKTGSALTSAVTKARPFLDRPDGLIDALDGEQVLEHVIVDGVCNLVAEQVGGAADAEQRLAALRAELEELNDPARSQLARWEAALVVFAHQTDPALLPSGIALLVDALLPAEHDKRARQAEDDRGLYLTPDTVGSGWYVKGKLDDETGEMLATVIDAAAVTDPANPDDTRAHADGQAALDDPTLPPQDWPVDQPAPRSKPQRRHDALKRALQALLDSAALGVRGKAAPHVGVTVGLDFLDGLPGSLPARTDHGVRLSREQVRKLLCRSTFTRLVLDARHRVVEVSHTQRTSTALERLILKTEGGTVCWGSGCKRGPATGHRLIPHHGSLFSETGVTELADTVMFCEIDHDHELHTRGRNIRLKDGRILGPRGWVRR